MPAQQPPLGSFHDPVQAAGDRELAARAPLAARMRPNTLDEVVGQPHLLGPGAPLRALIESDRLGSVLLWGPPGTGKTTLARVIAATTDREFVALSAVTAGVKDVRGVIEGARARLAGGDGRAALTTLEVALDLAHHAGGRTRLELGDVERSRQMRVLRYGEDDHYDVISAFIKAIRGSDPDAGLYWLARMLEVGEDARFIARRLVILASEDVGMADSNGLVVADAAARAVEFVGLPEAALNLAHCVVYLATAPKSNRAMLGLARAGDDVRRRQAGPVPAPLRSEHPYQRHKLQEGGGYVYPHDRPMAFVRQAYRPPELEGHVYYVPTEHGDEATIAARLRQLWGDDVYDRTEAPKGKPGLPGGETR